MLETSLSPVKPYLYIPNFEDGDAGTAWEIDELLLDSDDTFRWNILTGAGYISFRLSNLQHSIEKILPMGKTHDYHFKIYKDISANDIYSDKFVKKDAEYAQYLSTLSGISSNVYNSLCRRRFSFIPVQRIIEYGNRTLEIFFGNHQILLFTNVSNPVITVNPIIDLYDHSGLRVWYFDDTSLWSYHEISVEHDQYGLIAQFGEVTVSFAFTDVTLSW